MNIYQLINQAIEYIENNLENEIEYKKIAQILQMNEYMAQNAFYILCNISIADYIRRRRLSNAGYDLYNTDMTIMDIAIKYQYNNATSFSRAFEKFHGIKPSTVRKNPEGLKIYSRIKFKEEIEEKIDIEYSIVEKDELVLYGIGKETNLSEIMDIAPKYWKEEIIKYYDKYGEFDYGMTSYKSRFSDIHCKYWLLYKNKVEEKEFKKVVIPKSKWLVFKINSQETEDIQEVTQRFYREFIPSTKYKFRELPELEYYHDGIVELMIPIED